MGLVAGCTSTVPQGQSDWEKTNAARLSVPESVERPALPPFPRTENLVEIYVSATADFKYFVDEATLGVSPRERVIRYVLVARSPNGVENVRYEELRCPDEQRLLALGRPDGSWGGQPSDWREVKRGTAFGWHYALARNYFCPHRDPIRTVGEGVEALRNKGHPAVEVKSSMGGGD